MYSNQIGYIPEPGLPALQLPQMVGNSLPRSEINALGGVYIIIPRSNLSPGTYVRVYWSQTLIKSLVVQSPDTDLPSYFILDASLAGTGDFYCYYTIKEISSDYEFWSDLNSGYIDENSLLDYP